MQGIRLNYMKLQNGSDIRGIAVAGVPGEDVNFTPARAYYIGAAFAEYVAEKKQKETGEIRLAIGHDSRISADPLMRGLIAGIIQTGAKAADCGLASTPAMFMSTVLEGMMYDGALMLTASHLPYNRNGVKCMTRDGGFEKKEIAILLERAEQKNIEAWAHCEHGKDGETLIEHQIQAAYESYGANVKKEALMDAYCLHLRRIICWEVNANVYEKPLDGLKIVVDAGNGAGGFFVSNVLEPLGADTTGSQFLEPDGMFPNHIPNPENKEAMEAIRKATMEHHADMGLIFDTDVDRAAAVLADGTSISKNALIAMISAIVAKSHPRTTVVTDSVTSDALTIFLEETLGLTHCRFKRGYKNVINEAIRLNAEGHDCQLAIETSGHAALKENYFLDDGAYLSVKLLCELARSRQDGRKMEDLIKGLVHPAQTAEFRMTIKINDYASYGQLVLNEFMEFASWQADYKIAPDNYEGVRISFSNYRTKGWLLLRMSLHEPLLVLNIETENENGVFEMVNDLLPFFEQCDYLDLSVLLDYLEGKR